MPEAGVDAILSCWLKRFEERRAADAAGVPVVVRRALENRADFAGVWFAMARVAKLRLERREGLVAVRMAAEAEEESLMAAAMAVVSITSVVRVSTRIAKGSCCACRPR